MTVTQVRIDTVSKPSTRTGLWFARGFTVLIALALATSLPRALYMMQTGAAPGVAVEQVGGLQYVREACLIVLTMLLVNHMAVRKRAVVGRVTIGIGVTLVTVVVTLLVVRSVFNGVPTEIIVFGLRALLYPLIFISLRWMTVHDARDLLYNVARYAKPLVLIEGGVALYQSQTAAGIFGATFLGVRPWGTMATPNALAATMVAFALLFAVAKPKRWWLWLAATLFVAFLSGSRTGTLGVVLIVGALIAYRIPYRALFYPFAALVVVAFLFLFSSVSFSGREIEQEGRFDQWLYIFELLPAEAKIFGLGVGVGSNASISLYGKDALSGVVADSQIVASYLSFGVLGIVVMAWCVVALWRRSTHRNKILIVPVIMLLGLVYNIAEVSPANVLLALVAGAAATRALDQTRS